jgi:hypothetical protein
VQKPTPQYFRFFGRIQRLPRGSRLEKEKKREEGKEWDKAREGGLGGSKLGPGSGREDLGRRKEGAQDKSPHHLP